MQTHFALPICKSRNKRFMPVTLLDVCSRWLGMHQQLSGTSLHCLHDKWQTPSIKRYNLLTLLRINICAHICESRKRDMHILLNIYVCSHLYRLEFNIVFLLRIFYCNFSSSTQSSISSMWYQQLCGYYGCHFSSIFLKLVAWV